MSVTSGYHNKENFRLLDLSSEDESEDLQLEIIPSRKKKMLRKERTRVIASRAPEPNTESDVKIAIRWAYRTTLVLWLIILTWLCASLYDQVSVLNSKILKISVSSSSITDALQICHSAAKELRGNTSDLRASLTILQQKHMELEKRVEKATEELSGVSEQLAAAPKLADTPRRLAELQRTVAEIGSQINSYEGALKSAHKQAVTAAGGVDEVRSLLHDLEGKTNETISNVSALAKREDVMRQDIDSLNSTIVTRLDMLKMRIEEMKRPVATVAPTSSSTTSTTTPSTTTLTSTTTSAAPTTPGQPIKPIVLLGTS